MAGVFECIFISLHGPLPSFDETVETVRRRLIEVALDRSEGNQTKAAALLGITRSRFGDYQRRANGLPVRPNRNNEDAAG